MKTIKINKLTIKDFRGQNKTIELSNNVEIKGRNQSGKSTILNAILWLFLGTDVEGRANYQLFDNTIEQTYENSKVASVEANITIDDIDYTLKRTAQIGWTRKRGHVEYERKGSDTYKFYVDEIERSATEFKSFIEEQFAQMDKLAIMLNLQHFLGLDWKVQRKMFESLIGEIKESDFKGDYSDIKSDLAKYSTDEIKTRYKALMKPIKENVATLPTTIEALTNNLPKVEDLSEIEDSIKDAKEQIAELDSQILGDMAEMNKRIEKQDAIMSEISKLRKEYQEKKIDYSIKEENKVSDLMVEIDSVNRKNANIELDNKLKKEKYDSYKDALKKEQIRLKALQEVREVLLKRNKEVKAMQFTDDKCPYCGQPLPEDKLEEAKKKFLELKEAKHQSIVSDGKFNKTTIDECEKHILGFEKYLSIPLELREEESTKELEAKLDDLKKSFVEFDKTIEGKKILAKIEEKQALLKDNKPSDNEGLIRMRNSLLEEIQENSKKLGLKDERERQLKKIDSLQNELKENACELASYEGRLEKLQQYEREKAAIISFKVNRLFDFVKVEMTTTDKSGNIVDTCKVLDDNGVDCNVTNFASRVKASIDISNAFCKFYDLDLPLIVDFAESISSDNFPKSDRQTIKLVVTDDDFEVTNKED